jgi:hypothetical protein
VPLLLRKETNVGLGHTFGSILLFGGFYFAVGLAVAGLWVGGPAGAVVGWMIGWYIDYKSGRIK